MPGWYDRCTDLCLRPAGGPPPRAHARAAHQTVLGRVVAEGALDGGAHPFGRVPHACQPLIALVAQLGQLRVAIPREWTVLVPADRGLYAGWLFRRIARLGWHPFLRINQGCKFRPAGPAHFVWLCD